MGGCPLRTGVTFSNYRCELFRFCRGVACYGVMTAMGHVTQFNQRTSGRHHQHHQHHSANCTLYYMWSQLTFTAASMLLIRVYCPIVIVLQHMREIASVRH